MQARNYIKHSCDGKALILIDLLDNPLTVLEKLIELDEFLPYLKIDSERYTSLNSSRFVISFEELRVFIGFHFSIGYHKLVLNVLGNRRPLCFSKLYAQCYDKREI